MLHRKKVYYRLSTSSGKTYLYEDGGANQIYNIYEKYDGTPVSILEFDVLPNAKIYDDLTPSIRKTICVEEDSGPIYPFFISEVTLRKNKAKHCVCVSGAYFSRWFLVYNGKMRLDASDTIDHFTAPYKTHKHIQDLLNLAVKYNGYAVSSTSCPIINNFSVDFYSATQRGSEPTYTLKKYANSSWGKSIYDLVLNIMKDRNLICRKSSVSASQPTNGYTDELRLISLDYIKTLDPNVIYTSDDVLAEDFQITDSLDTYYTEIVAIRSAPKEEDFPVNYSDYFETKTYSRDTANKGKHQYAVKLGKDETITNIIGTTTDKISSIRGIKQKINVNPVVFDGGTLETYIGRRVRFETSILTGDFIVTKINRCIDFPEKSKFEFDKI